MSALEIVQEKAVDKQQIRTEIAYLQEQMLKHPGAFNQLDTMHHFSDGVYARTVLMKKGDLVCGKIHKLEHLVCVSAGKARVVSEEFGAVEITAPYIFKSPAGAKRILFILEDMVWTTFHKNPTNTEDLAVLEEELIAKDYSEVKT